MPEPALPVPSRKFSITPRGAAPAGMPELTYGTVSWTVVGIAEDSADLDATPDVEQINGWVTFTPAPPKIVKAGTGAVTVLPRPQKYQITNGRLVDSQDRTSVSLVANDSPGTTPQGWSYHADWELEGGYNFGSFDFVLAGGDAIDLSDVQPLLEPSPGTIIIKGEKGDPGDFTIPELEAAIGTGEPTGGTVVKRFPDGSAAFSTVYVGEGPDNQAATRDELANLGTDLATPDTVVRRNADGHSSFTRAFGNEAPFYDHELTRKDYVDIKSRLPAAGLLPAHTLALGDEGKWLYSGEPTVVTIPAHADVPFAIGTVIELNRLAGTLSVVGASGVQIQAPGGNTTAAEQYSQMRLVKITDNIWVLNGETEHNAGGVSGATGSSLVRRDAGGNADFTRVYLVSQPLIDEHATPRGYVDKGVAHYSKMKPGRWYGAPSSNGGWGVAVNNRLEVTPLWVPNAVNIDALMARVETAGEAGCTFRLGVYGSDEYGDPATLLLDAGTIEADTPGNKLVACDLDIQPGMYWLAVVVQGAPTTPPVINKTSTQTWPIGRTVTDVNGGQGGYMLADISGALPATPPQVSSYYDANYSLARIGS